MGGIKKSVIIYLYIIKFLYAYFAEISRRCDLRQLRQMFLEKSADKIDSTHRTTHFPLVER